MTRETQWERDERRRAREAFRLERLLLAAHRALLAMPECDERAELARALGEDWDLQAATRDAKQYREEQARKATADEETRRALAMLDELPDAPPRTRCAIRVTRAMGRWTDFGRCDNIAKRIALVQKGRFARSGPRVEVPVCQIHARKALVESLDVAEDDPKDTGPWWWRTKGLCMSRAPIGGEYCDVRVETGTGLHEGDHRTKGKPRKRWPNRRVPGATREGGRGGRH